MPLNLLGAPRGTPVTLNGNSFFKYNFAFQSLKLCEGCIIAHLSGFFFSCCFGCFCSMTLREYVAGLAGWQEDPEGICEGRGCWRALQGGRTHAWQSVILAACWEVVAGTCCPPKHTWALVQSTLICTAPDPQTYRAQVQRGMADRDPLSALLLGPCFP